MNAEEYRAALAEDASLAVGMRVTVRWTNSFRQFETIGYVSKVNDKSVRVRIAHDVPIDGREGYLCGHELVLPRLADFKRWTANNCVRPAPEG